MKIRPSRQSVKGARKIAHLPFPLVYVEWVDHSGSEGWRPIAQLKADNEIEYAVQSIGWLIAESSKRVTIAATLTIPNEDKSERDASGYMTIDRKLIRTIRRMRF